MSENDTNTNTNGNTDPFAGLTPTQVMHLIASWAATLPAAEANARGIVLTNERLKVRVPAGDRAVEFTLSLYAHREPITEAEAAALTKASETQAAKRKTKTEEEQAKRERETHRAFQLGQEATIGAMKNLGDLAQAARIIGKLNT